MTYRTASAHAFTAAQFVRQFAECRSLARDEPVFISNYGRTTHALVAISQFEALAHNANASGEAAVVADVLREWGMRAGQAFMVCDTGLRVRSINSLACSMLGVTETESMGLALENLLLAAKAQRKGAGETNSARAERPDGADAPQLYAPSNLLVTLVRRCLHLREDVSAEVPSPFSSDSWLKLNGFVWQDQLIITFKDITAEIRLERLADRKAALAQAMALQDGLAAVQLSLRGQIEEAGSGLAQCVGLPQARLLGAHFMDMVDIQSRAALRAAMEAALRGDGAQCLALDLISNTGGTARVTASLVQLRGAYGVEGLTMVLKREIDGAGFA